MLYVIAGGIIIILLIHRIRKDRKPDAIQDLKRTRDSLDTIEESLELREDIADKLSDLKKKEKKVSQKENKNEE